MKQIIMTTFMLLMFNQSAIAEKHRAVVMDIPAGRVEKIATDEELRNYRITLNNKTIYKSDYQITDIDSVHKFYEKTLIIVSRGCMGNGSSCYPRLTLLTIYNNGKYKIYNIDDEFPEYEISNKGEDVVIKAYIASDRILYVKYGNDKVTKYYKKVAGKLSKDNCKELYDLCRACSRTQVKKDPFNEVESFARAYWGVLSYYSKDTRFNRNEFKRSCVDASRNGKVMPYSTFAKNICQ